MEIKEVIVVEGKMDTSKLKSCLKVDTVETNGSEISEETLTYIKHLSETRGIIVLTDPDYPGQRIRQRIVDIVPNCKHAFIERDKAIKGRKLGVAEASCEVIIEALENVVSFSNATESISWTEFISLGIIGNKTRRLFIYETFKLGYGNAKTLFKRLNLCQINKEAIIERLKEYEGNRDNH